MSRRFVWFLTITLVTSAIILGACAGQVVETPGAEIVIYNWADDIPPELLEQFTQESGITVKYVSYGSSEEAVENIRAGNQYDVIFIENQFVPTLAQGGFLDAIDYRLVDNLKNIDPAFIGREHDPNNEYSIPYTWGTTGIVLRPDLLKAPVRQWTDLWSTEQTGAIGLRELPREILGVILVSQGFSINSENPAEIEQALDELLARRDSFTLVSAESSEAISLMESGKITAMIGWSGDVQEARERNLEVEYILPEDCAIFWGDSFTISSTSTHKEQAHAFINFLLRPEVSAEITNQVGYPSANLAANKYINPDLLSDPAIYPRGNTTDRFMEKAQMILPVSERAEKKYLDAWERFQLILKEQ